MVGIIVVWNLKIKYNIHFGGITFKILIMNGSHLFTMWPSFLYHALATQNVMTSLLLDYGAW